jgi:hypothetical protein
MRGISLIISTLIVPAIAAGRARHFVALRTKPAKTTKS